VYYNKECAYLTMLTMLLGIVGWEIFSRIWGPGYLAKDLNIIFVGTVIAVGDVVLRMSRTRASITKESSREVLKSEKKSVDFDIQSATKPAEQISPLTLFLDSNRGAAYGYFPGWAVGAAIIIGCLMKMN